MESSDFYEFILIEVSDLHEDTDSAGIFFS